MRFLRGYWLLLLGVVVLVIGIVASITQVTQVVSFGWTAYAPLTSTTFTPGFAPYLPWLLIVVGVGLIAAWIGYRVGRARGTSRDA